MYSAAQREAKIEAAKRALHHVKSNRRTMAQLLRIIDAAPAPGPSRTNDDEIESLLELELTSPSPQPARYAKQHLRVITAVPSDEFDGLSYDERQVYDGLHNHWEGHATKVDIDIEEMRLKANPYNRNLVAGAM